MMISCVGWVERWVERSEAHRTDMKPADISVGLTSFDPPCNLSPGGKA
jgi:hypothetical protein